jgi:hypothetical protein
VVWGADLAAPARHPDGAGDFEDEDGDEAFEGAKEGADDEVTA